MVAKAWSGLLAIVKVFRKRVHWLALEWTGPIHSDELGAASKRSGVIRLGGHALSEVAANTAVEAARRDVWIIRGELMEVKMADPARNGEFRSMRKTGEALQPGGGQETKS
jgi:hypothetical protein